MGDTLHLHAILTNLARFCQDMTTLCRNKLVKNTKRYSALTIIVYLDWTYQGIKVVCDRKRGQISRNFPRWVKIKSTVISNITIVTTRQ